MDNPMHIVPIILNSEEKKETYHSIMLSFNFQIDNGKVSLENVIILFM